MITHLNYLDSAVGTAHYLTHDYVDGMITGGLIIFGIVASGIALTLAWITLLRFIHGCDSTSGVTRIELDCMTCTSVQCENCPYTNPTKPK
jgi:hypothetical protein